MDGRSSIYCSDNCCIKHSIYFNFRISLLFLKKKNFPLIYKKNHNTNKKKFVLIPTIRRMNILPKFNGPILTVHLKLKRSKQWVQGPNQLDNGLHYLTQSQLPRGAMKPTSCSIARDFSSSFPSKKQKRRAIS